MLCGEVGHYHPLKLPPLNQLLQHHQYHYTIITMNTKPLTPLPPQYHQYYYHHNPYVLTKLSYITPTTITITTLSKILTTTPKLYIRVVIGGCGGLLGIGVCNDVVMRMVVVAVVGYCSVKGCYYVVLEVL